MKPKQDEGGRTYVVTCAPGVTKELRKMPSSVQVAIEMSIAAIAFNPRPRGVERLISDKRTWRLRVGEYRILYWIDDQKSQVLIQRVANRKDAYPRRGTLAVRRKGRSGQ